MKKLAKLTVIPLLFLCSVVALIACGNGGSVKQLGDELVDSWYIDLGGIVRIDMIFSDNRKGSMEISISNTEPIVIGFDWEVPSVGKLKTKMQIMDDDYLGLIPQLEDSTYSISQNTLSIITGVQELRLTRKGHEPEVPDQNVDPELFGSWTAINNNSGDTIMYTFNDDGSGEMTSKGMMNIEYSFYWNIPSDGILELIISGMPTNMQYSIDGNQLTLSDENQPPLVFTKVE